MMADAKRNLIQLKEPLAQPREREKGDLSARKGSSEAVTLEGKCPQNRGLWER